MSDNDAGELLPVIQADRDAAASAYYAWMSSNPVIPTKMVNGKADDHSMVKAFARHRLSTTPASAGVLVEAQALVKRLRSPGSGALWGPPITEEAADMIEALSTTATPASDGFAPWKSETVTPPADWDGTGEAIMVDPSDMHVSIGVPPKEMPWQRTVGWKVIVAYRTTPTPDRFGEGYRAGEWRDIEQEALRKGLRRSPKYYPAIGETCRMSGPNCDDADGYTWTDVEVLWRDDLFIVTRKPGCWPTVTKLELALFEPAAQEQSA